MSDEIVCDKCGSVKGDDAITKLNKDLRQAAKTMSDAEARYLVDAYYTMQDDRKRAHNQVRAAGEEPHAVIAWLSDNSKYLEGAIKITLDLYTDNHAVGCWIKSNYGLGPVLAAGLLAHIDIEKAPTVGHIWRYAGLDPTQKWNKGEKRPWNADLKVICWKIGQSFMKFSNEDGCYYGRLYRDRKQFEVARNDGRSNSPGNAARAARLLTEKKFDKGTEAFKWLSGYYPHGVMTEMLKIPGEAGRSKLLREKILQKPNPDFGRLPPAQIDAMARRWAVKLFLSHLHGFWYEHHFKVPPPLPYPIAILGHAHKIHPHDQDRAA